MSLVGNAIIYGNSTITDADVVDGSLIGTSIDNAVIGGTTPASIISTTFTANGNVTVSDANTLTLGTGAVDLGTGALTLGGAVTLSTGSTMTVTDGAVEQTLCFTGFKKLTLSGVHTCDIEYKADSNTAIISYMRIMLYRQS